MPPPWKPPMPPPWKPPMPPPWKPPPPPPPKPPRAEATSGLSKPNEASASKAITVLRNITHSSASFLLPPPRLTHQVRSRCHITNLYCTPDRNASVNSPRPRAGVRTCGNALENDRRGLRIFPAGTIPSSRHEHLREAGVAQIDRLRRGHVRQAQAI